MLLVCALSMGDFLSGYLSLSVAFWGDGNNSFVGIDRRRNSYNGKTIPIM